MEEYILIKVAREWGNLPYVHSTLPWICPCNISYLRKVEKEGNTKEDRGQADGRGTEGKSRNGNIFSDEWNEREEKRERERG